MTTRTREVQLSLLDDRIDILERNAADASPLKPVFKTVSAILALVRDKMVAGDDSSQLSDYCFGICEALNTKVQAENVDNLKESVRMAVEDLGRVLREIEQTLRANVPQIEYDKSKIDCHKLEIQQILGSIGTPGLSLTRDNGAEEPMDVDSVHTPTTSNPENALLRLIRRDFVLHELPSLIEEIFAHKDTDHTIHCLPKEEVQNFVDVIDEVLDRPDLPLWVRVKCLRPLYRTCGRHGLLPKVLNLPVFYDRTGCAVYRGGYADVWKGQCRGREVAVKVLRTYSTSDLQKIIGRFCKEVLTWKTLQHPNVLPLTGVTMSEAQFAMVSEWMVNGNINEFVKANSDANRLKLLGDVARGLIYIHQRGMIHGDLKGANILIDQTGRARLADFGLLTIISDPANILSSSSCAQGGTARWMGPELIAPQEFGFKTSRPTKFSDCYSLGMVIYETISGNLPFHEDTDIAVFLKVVRGERPSREDGFADSLWKTMEQCWASQPSNRPSIEGVLQCLEMCSNASPPSPTATDEEMENLTLSGKGFNEMNAFVTVCRNCQAKSAPLCWADPEGKPLCNSCGIFYIMHGVARPLPPKTAKKRNRTNGTPSTSTTPKRLSSPQAPPTARPPIGYPGSYGEWNRGASDKAHVLEDRDGEYVCEGSGQDGEERDAKRVKTEREKEGSDPQPGPIGLQHGPSQGLMSFASAGPSPASPSGLLDSPYGPGTSTALITTASHKSVPALSLGEIDPYTLPPELKREGKDWLAVYNPGTERVLSVSLVHTLHHEGVVCCVQFSKDGQYLATGCNHTANIYDTKTGSRICALVDETTDNTHDLYIRSVCFSPDGRLLATGATDKTLRIWDIAKRQIRKVFQGHTREIYSLAFSTDGRLIVSGSGDRTARIWDMTDGSSKILATADLPDDDDTWVVSVAINSDGRLVATGSLDSVVRIWDARMGELLERLQGHRGSVYGVIFTPDGRGLVSGSVDKTLKYWDVSRLVGGSGCRSNLPDALKCNSLDGEEDVSGSSACIRNFTGHKDCVLSVAVSHNGRWVVSGSKDQAVQFWDAKTGIAHLMLKGHERSVTSVDLSPDGSTLATGSSDFQTRIWYCPDNS